MRAHRTVGATAVAGALAMAVLVTGAAAARPADQSPAATAPETSGPVRVLAPIGGISLAPVAPPGAALSADKVTDAVDGYLSGGPLGSGASPARIVDVASGETLYAADDEQPVEPASTMKLVTSLSVLSALQPQARISTRTVIRDPAAATPRVLVVGGGDPSLRSTGSRGTDPLAPASLTELATATASQLAAKGIATVRVGYDTSLFSGPAMHPSWSTSFPGLGIVAPVSSLLADEGRADPDRPARSSDPARAAANRFVRALEARGIEVTGSVSRATVKDVSVELAAVQSAPLSVLVEHMLATSDNTYAETLARVAAAATGHPGSFEGLATRAADVLAQYAIPRPDGTTFADGSGLSRQNRLAPGTLTGLLRAVSRTAGFTGPVSSGLPVAGSTGSLRQRFTDGAGEEARGLVRAKTGTLTGVVGLAGFVSRPDGRLLAFAFLDDSVPSGANAGRAELDRALGELVSCACEAAAPVPNAS